MTPQRRCASPNAWPARQPPTALPSALTAADAPPRRLCPRRAVATALLAASASRPPPARLSRASALPPRPSGTAHARRPLEAEPVQCRANARSRLAHGAHSHQRTPCPAQAPTGPSYPPRHWRTRRRSRAPAPCRAVLLLGNQLRRVSMPAASGASPPATPPAAASGMCGGAPCCVAAAGSDVAAAGAGPGSVAARAKNGAQLGLRSEQERVRAAVLSTASSLCGLLGLYLSRLGCVGC